MRCAVAVCILLAAALLACDGGDAPTDERTQDVGKADAEAEWDALDKEQWADAKDGEKSLPAGDVVERTVAVVEASGGEVHYVEHAGRGERAALVTPVEFVDGETPLVVSLHGFGGDSAWQSVSVPLHMRVNSDGFALLLPNGVQGAEGSRFWNPTDECCEGGKSGEDDIAYLTELVAEAREAWNFGPVYFFGYSNGGFMAHHMACKGLPGLRAVASLAGTSYVEESSCDGAPPVSALHVHGTADRVIMFQGDETEAGAKGERAFYLGAREMVERWSRKAGCEWPSDAQPYADVDLDEHVPGAETQAYRVETGCAGGVTVELWASSGSGHAPGYGEGFVAALVAWLLARG